MFLNDATKLSTYLGIIVNICLFRRKMLICHGHPMYVPCFDAYDNVKNFELVSLRPSYKDVFN